MCHKKHSQSSQEIQLMVHIWAAIQTSTKRYSEADSQNTQKYKIQSNE